MLFLILQVHRQCEVCIKDWRQMNEVNVKFVHLATIFYAYLTLSVNLQYQEKHSASHKFTVTV